MAGRRRARASCALLNARKIALLATCCRSEDASVDGHRHTGEWAKHAGVDVLIAHWCAQRLRYRCRKASRRAAESVALPNGEEVRLNIYGNLCAWRCGCHKSAAVTPWVWRQLSDFYAELAQVMRAFSGKVHLLHNTRLSGETSDWNP